MLNPLFDMKKSGDCSKCKRDKHCQNPRMTYTGEGNKQILLIGESPSKNDDARNEHFIGHSGTILRDAFDYFGVDIDTDCWKTNVVKCWTNSAPTLSQIKYCSPFLDNEIKDLQPRKIFLFGLSAIQAFMKDRVPKTGKITDWLGYAIPDELTQAWIYPMYHPSFILQMEGKGRYEQLFYEHIKAAIQQEGTDLIFPTFSNREYSIYKLGEDEAIHYLDSLNSPHISIDYETTGLKPQAPGHKVVTMSISQDAFSAHVFKVTKKLYPYIRRILNNPDIKMSAQNLKFERMWSKVVFGTPGVGWIWDSMIATHLLNNQTQTGLKFQTYVNFGIPDYSTDVNKFLEADTANGFNKISQANEEKLLFYNALDTIFEHRLSLTQRLKVKGNMLKAYTLIHNGLMALSDTEIHGLTVDMEHYQKQEELLTKQETQITNKLLKAKEGKIWKEKYKDKFNLGSSDQLRDILFKELNYKAENLTEKGNISVDKKALEGIDSPFVKDLLTLRQTQKIKNTYIAQITREEVDGKIHPLIGFAPISWRSSVSKPSFQNIPSRIPETVLAIKGGIIPQKGFRFLDVDYGSIEVRVSAMYHKDPTMLDYLWSEGKDMHRDMAMECYILNEDEVGKDTRKCAKNSFVFASFYGDYYVNCARNLWENIHAYGLTTKDNNLPLLTHLKKHNITNYQKFEKHIQDVEHRFWNERFKIYNQWKNDTWQSYLEKGYLESFFGFLFTGPMDRNNALNYQIQSTAFHFLLWTYTKISSHIKKNKMKSRLVGETHDSFLAETPPEEFEDLVTITKKVMVDDLIKKFNWINTPIEIEMESTTVDESWYYKKVFDSYINHPEGVRNVT